MATPYVLSANLRMQLDNGALKGIVGDINRELKNVNGIDFKINSAAVSGIQGVSNATRTLSRDLSLVNSRARDASNTVQAFGEQIGLAARRFAAFAIGPGAIAAVAYGFKAALGEAFAFEKELIRLEQISGQSKRQLEGVVDAVTELSQKFGVSSQELLGVATTLKQAGIATDDLKVALEAVAKASLAPTFGNMEDAAQGALGLFKQFGVQANELEGKFGSINAVASRFATEAKEINTAISRTGAAFNAAGGDVNELVALFSAVRGTTRETAESVSTGLRTIFSRLQRSSTIDSLQQLGIELRVTREEAKKLGDTSLEGNFIGAFEAAKRLGEALKNLSTTDPRFANIAEQLGGYRQIEKTIPLLQQMTTAQSAYNVALAGSASLNSSAEKATEGFLNQVTQLKEELFALVRVISDDTSFKAFLSTLTEAGSLAVKLGGYLTPLLPLLGAFALAKGVTSVAPLLSGIASRVAKPVLFAEGGVVPGYGNGDTVHARMTPGEFVIKKSAAQSIGYNKLHQMNHYADGGFINKMDSAIFDINEIEKERARSNNRNVSTALINQPIKIAQMIKGAQGGFKNELSGIIHNDSQYLGHGVEALVLKSPSENFVYRIGMNENKGVSFGFKGRPKDQDVVQPIFSKDINGLHIEKLPFMPSVQSQYDKMKASGANQRELEAFRNKFNTDAAHLQFSMLTRGLHAPDSTSMDNVSYDASGKLKLLDPGFINNIKGYAGGGSVDAMLTPGEFVFGKQAATRIGRGNLRAMNQGGVAHFTDGGMVGYADGGDTFDFESDERRKNLDIQAKRRKTYNARVAAAGTDKYEADDFIRGTAEFKPGRKGKYNKRIPPFRTGRPFSSIGSYNDESSSLQALTFNPQITENPYPESDIFQFQNRHYEPTARYPITKESQPVRTIFNPIGSKPINYSALGIAGTYGLKASEQDTYQIDAINAARDKKREGAHPEGGIGLDPIGIQQRFESLDKYNPLNQYQNTVRSRQRGGYQPEIFNRGVSQEDRQLQIRDAALAEFRGDLGPISPSLVKSRLSQISDQLSPAQLARVQRQAELTIGENRPQANVDIDALTHQYQVGQGVRKNRQLDKNFIPASTRQGFANDENEVETYRVNSSKTGGFKFEALDTQGKEVSDSLQAISEDDAQRKIRQMGLFVTKIDPIKKISGLTPEPGVRKRYKDRNDNDEFDIPDIRSSPNYATPKSPGYNYSTVELEEANKRIKAKHGVDLQSSATSLRIDEIEVARGRVLKELVTAESSLLRSITPGISAHAADALALENVVKAREAESKIIIQANGQKILASTLEKAAANGIRQTAEGLFPRPQRPDVPYEGFRSIGRVATDRFGRFGDSLSDFGSSIGGAASGFSNRLPAVFKNPQVGFAASVAGSYLASGIDSLLQTPENAVASGSIGGLKAGRGISGAIGGAATGAFAGSFIASTSYPGVGTAVGLVIGAGVGFAEAISKAAKEINDVKLSNSVKDIELNLRRFNEGLEEFGQFKSSTSSSIRDIKANNIETATSQATGYFGGFDKKAFEGIYTKLNNDTVGSSAPSIAQALSKEASNIGKASLGKNVDDVKKNFIQVNSDLIGVIASVNKVDPKVFEKQFSKSIDDGLRSATRDRQEKGVNNFIIGLERLSTGIESAVSATSGLQNKFKTLSSLNLDTVKLNSISSNLNPLNPNQASFSEALNKTANGLGGGGEQFTEQGRAAQAVSNAVADVLPTLIREAGNTERGNLTAKLRGNIESSIGPDAQLPEFKRAIGLLIDEIGSVNVPDLIKRSGNDASKITENLLKPIIDGYVQSAQKIQKLQEQYGNDFLGGLAAINQHVTKLGEESDKFNQIGITKERFGASVESERTGRRAQALDLLPLERLDQPFLQRQERLTGFQGQNAVDPRLIGARLRGINEQIPGALDRVNKQTPGTAGFDQASRALAQLQGQAGDLQSALRGLADQSNLNAGIQEKLNRIEDNRAGRESLVNQYIGADSSGRAELERGLLLIQATTSVDKQGKINTNINQLSDSDQALAHRVAGSGGKGEIDIGGKQIALSDIFTRQAADYVGGNLLGVDQRVEKSNLDRAQGGNIDRERAAQEEIGKNQDAFLGSLRETLVSIQKSYFEELKRIDQQRVVAAANNSYLGANEKLNTIYAKNKSFGILNRSGITDDGTLEYNKSNQNKILEYYNLAKEEEKARNLKQNFDPSKVKFGSNNELFDSLRDQLKDDVLVGKTVADFRSKKASAVGGYGPIPSDQSLISDVTNKNLQDKIDDVFGNKSGVHQQLPPSKYRDNLPGGLPSDVSVDDFSKALSKFDGSNTLAKFPKELKDASEALSKAAADLIAADPKGIGDRLIAKTIAATAFNPTTFKAEGGSIFGPTRGTDKIPAMLSEGEYVVNARSTSANLGLLKKINASKGSPIYRADGGSTNPFDQVDIGKPLRNASTFNPFNQKADEISDDSPFDNVDTGRSVRNSSNRNPFNGRGAEPKKFSGAGIPFDWDEYRSNRRDEANERISKRITNAPFVAALNYANAQFANSGASLAQKQILAQTADPLAYFGRGRAGIESQSGLNIGAVGGRDKANKALSRITPFQQLYDQIRFNRSGYQSLPISKPKGFASGGMVDNIPAYLSEGEYVVNADSVKAFGAHNLDRINRYADGGSVSHNPLYGGESSSVNPFGDSIPQMTVVFKGFDNTSSLLGKNIVLFEGAATKLSNVLEKFPNKITLEGNQTLSVIINGAETISRIMPDLKSYVETTISEALNRLVKDKIPDA